jgi:hypothetical protein
METFNPAVSKYFLQQQYGGVLPVYMGARHQRGHGLGNVLSGALRYVTPILKDVGRSALKKVPYIVSQTLGGKPVKETLKNVAVAEGKKFLGNTLGKMLLKPALGGQSTTFLGGTHIKRKASTASSRPATAGKKARRVVSRKGVAPAKRRRRRVAEDIFA